MVARNLLFLVCFVMGVKPGQLQFQNPTDSYFALNSIIVAALKCGGLYGMRLYLVHGGARDANVNFLVRDFSGTIKAGSLKLVKSRCPFGDVYRNISGQIEFYHSIDEDPWGFLCSWTIEAEENKVVEMEITDMTFLVNENCSEHFLKILDGYIVKGVYCGIQPELKLVSDSREVTVQYQFSMVQDVSEIVGFSLTFKQISDPTCGYLVSEKSGSFGSSFVDENYVYQDVDCTWHIIRPSRYGVIDLYITEMNVGIPFTCNVSYLEIFDGESMIGRYCAAEPLPIMTSYSRNMQIHLVSPFTLSDSQFKAMYLIRDLPCSDSSCLCGGILTDPIGRLKSPDLDGDGLYESNLNCVWLVLANEGKNISFTVTAMDIEQGYSSRCPYDFLEIYNGDFNEVVGQYCNLREPQLPPPFLSSGNRILVRFVSDKSENYKGFTGIYMHISKDRFLDAGPEIMKENCMLNAGDMNGTYTYPNWLSTEITEKSSTSGKSWYKGTKTLFVTEQPTALSGEDSKSTQLTNNGPKTSSDTASFLLSNIFVPVLTTLIMHSDHQ